MFNQPYMQPLDHGLDLLLPGHQPLGVAGIFPFALNVVNLADLHQRLLGNLTLVGRMQLKELAPRVCPATRLLNPSTHSLLVARKVIHQ